MFMIIFIPILMVLDFFGANITDDYVENNSEYASRYIEVLNNNVKNGNGYVSLSRILYFYLENENLTFDEIYKDNLSLVDYKQLTISEVCSNSKYSYYDICKENKINMSNQINEEQLKPFTPPLNTSDLNITSFFMEERIIYDKPNIHYGWDFSAKNNTKVYSVCDGIVKEINFKYQNNSIDKSGGGGNTIKIKCTESDVQYEVLYAHLYPNSSKVRVGDIVSQKQEIAGVGTTGYSTGPHLHFEVSFDKKKVDGLSLIDFNSQNNSYFNQNNEEPHFQ